MTQDIAKAKKNGFCLPPFTKKPTNMPIVVKAIAITTLVIVPPTSETIPETTKTTKQKNAYDKKNRAILRFINLSVLF